MFGALEAGGTKMVCGIGLEDGTIIHRESYPTTTPIETMEKIIAYFKQYDIKSLGVGAFGPVDVTEDSSTYGHILDTPKIEWRHFDLLGHLKKELNVPIKIDTDVNCSCLGEVTFGSAKGLDSAIYITIGTGIGVGVYINNQLVHGMLHPEGGHIYLPLHKEDNFQGVCPSHGTCFEGMASGVSIEKRWKKKAYELVEDDKVWEIEAHYISHGIVNYILTYSPKKVILGGGVMKQTQLLPLIYKKVTTLLNGYINTKELHHIEDYIVLSDLNDNQGLLGAIRLAILAKNS